MLATQMWGPKLRSPMPMQSWTGLVAPWTPSACEEEAGGPETRWLARLVNSADSSERLYPSLLPVAVTEPWWNQLWGEKHLCGLHFLVEIHHWGKPSQELKWRPKRNAAYWLATHSLISLLSYKSQDHLTRGEPCPHESLTSSLTKKMAHIVFKQENGSQTNMTEAILQLRLLLPRWF